jgi:uncharacterized membrane protein
MPRLAPAALALAALLSPAAALAQATERCFGVSLAGRNDGVGETEAPGTATRDFQGDAWTWVPAGRCTTLPLPPQPDGTPRRGAYQPLDRDPP